MGDSLDLGALFATADILTAPFDAKYAQLLAKMEQLGVKVGTAGESFGMLDEGLVATGASAGTAAAGVDKVIAATGASASAATKAAEAEARHAAALDETAGAMAAISGESDRVQQSYLRLMASRARLTELETSGSASTRQLASANASLIGAQRSLTAAQDASAVSSGRFSGALGGTLKMAGELGLIFGAFEAVKKTIDIGKEATAYQASMLMIRTSAGASAAEVSRMSAAVLSMSGPLATSPDKLADALYHVEQNGLRGQAALDALKVGAMGAKIGMADVEDTTNTMTIAMASGIHGVQNLQQAMGFMIATVGTGDMRLKDLNEALSGGILSVAKGFGASLQDVAAVLATLGDNGIRGTNAAQALRQTMMGFAAPAKGGADALRAVGLGMYDLRDAMESHGLVYAMNDLEQHMTSAGVTGSKVGAFITDAFGKRAGAGVGVLMGEIDRLNTKYAEAQKGADTFAERWTATTKTASFQFASLGASVQAEGVRMATAALPVATIIAGQLGGALHDLMPAISAIGSAFAPEMKLIGAAAVGAAYALHGVASVLSDIAPVLKVVGAAAVAMYTTFRLWGALTAIFEVVTTKLDLLAGRGVLALNALAVNFGLAAGSAEASAVTIGAAAEGASETVVAAGAQAEIGWAGVAGPIALAAVGILAAVSMFHKSTSASKEATDAAKAYSDALTGDGGKSTIVDSIVKQLSGNNVPQTLDKLNKALGSAQFTGQQFVTAISSGGPALAELQNRLDAVVKSGTTFKTTGGRAFAGAAQVMTPAAQAASKALKDLNTQQSALSAAAVKEIATFKSLGTVAAPVATVAKNIGLTSDQVKQYAGMLDLAVTSNGDLVDATQVNIAHLQVLGRAYNDASTSVQALLDADKTFASSGQSTADRAALIGATLKANAGDALDFATAMNATVTATNQLTSDMTSAAKSVGKNGESTKTLLDSIVKLKSGTIDYSKGAAAPLLSDLTSIQTAAINAASATYQHEKALIGGKAAADAAVTGYTNVEKSLTDQLVQMGLSKTAAQDLTTKYLGVPKNVKTLIEQEGADPVLTVLNRIGALLARLTGQPWTSTVSVNTNGAAAKLKTLQAQLDALHGRTLQVGVTGLSLNNLKRLGAVATGGTIVGDTVRRFATGGTAEGPSGTIRGPGTGTSDTAGLFALSDGEEVIRASQANKHRALLKAINAGTYGFAAGGTVPGGISHVGKDWIYDGIRYASERAAENAQTRAGTTLGKVGTTLNKDAHSLLGLESKGDIGALGAGFSKVNADLTKAGVPASFIRGLHDDNVAIVNATVARTKAGDNLKKANEALVAAKKVMAADKSTFAGAVTGTFDISTAGADPTTGVISGGGIMAQSAQAVTRARAFVSGLQKLIGMKIFPAGYVRQLAGKGPDALAEITALLSLSPAQMKTIATESGQLGGLANQIGAVASQRLDGAAVARSQAVVDRDKAIQAAADKKLAAANAKLAKDIAHEIGHLHLTGELGWKTGSLAVAVRTDQKASTNTRGTAR